MTISFLIYGKPSKDRGTGAEAQRNKRHTEKSEEAGKLTCKLPLCRCGECFLIYDYQQMKRTSNCKDENNLVPLRNA
ncbi:hypothetical protein ACO0LL_29190 [Undibacterium sp. TC4M20W]